MSNEIDGIEWREVEVTLSTSAGPLTVTGFISAPGLVVCSTVETRPDGKPGIRIGWWGVSHVPTGKRVNMFDYSELDDAKELATRLCEFDWTLSAEELQEFAPLIRAIESAYCVGCPGPGMRVAAHRT